ncbi:hypothetical protein BV898_03079 [Hypsibius exemplaris]|uniref:G-protein coupled receptors family 1 profile domain-containing protein n=1 Tax=Hypsibius exemplaris TaxID=2072580 RepID=A0A1W0X6N5_HYPEX|nr:hypothetical protein BV898_03079 [Hypsibius exemplaris]
MNETNGSVWLNASQNGSAATPLTADWTFLPTFQIISGVFALTGNSVVFMVIVCHRALWTPFNVFVVNLLIGNLLDLVTAYSMDIINNLYGNRWPLGEGWCTLYTTSAWYLQWSLQREQLSVLLHMTVQVGRNLPVVTANHGRRATGCSSC